MQPNHRKYIPTYHSQKVNLNVNRNSFDELIKAIPIYTALFIFLGFIDIGTYYDCFGINIIEYITLSEILLLFLNNVYLILVFILVLLFYSIISNPLIDDILSSFDRLITSPGFEKKHVIVSLLLLTFISIPILPILELNILTKICFVLYCIVLLQFGFVCIYRFCKKKRINIIYSFLTTFIFFFVIFFPVYNVLIKVPEIINGNSTINNIEFIYKDKITKTDSNFIYIGGVQSFVFCYDRKAKQTSVFKKDEIQVLKIYLK
jgi:hypothetical protein